MDLFKCIEIQMHNNGEITIFYDKKHGIRNKTETANTLSAK
jgi:hypothetical protein